MLPATSARQARRRGWEHAWRPRAAWHEGSCPPLRANAALLACASRAAIFPFFFFHLLANCEVEEGLWEEQKPSEPVSHRRAPPDEGLYGARLPPFPWAQEGWISDTGQARDDDSALLLEPYMPPPVQ